MSRPAWRDVIIMDRPLAAERRALASAAVLLLAAAVVQALSQASGAAAASPAGQGAGWLAHALHLAALAWLLAVAARHRMPTVLLAVGALLPLGDALVYLWLTDAYLFVGLLGIAGLVTANAVLRR